MIVVTGGAGFIGSCLVWRLNARGEKDIVIVDRLGSDEKWKNLLSLQYRDYYDGLDFIELLEKNHFGESIGAIVHLGACSSTTEKDSSFLMDNNYKYTMRLAQWHQAHKKNCRFIYASSAATYGDGAQGYQDSHETLHTLRPLNMYGYSKHLFDLQALDRGWLDDCAGLKYFNVFGPNEYHKGDMRSVIAKAYPQVVEQATISLFKSYNEKYRDGEQERDFIYVKDAVEMTLFLLDNPSCNGIFNIGSGVARCWNDVAKALFEGAQVRGEIHYIPMPPLLQSKYQYHTCAAMEKLRRAGCDHHCRTLEESVKEYVQEYLKPMRHLDTH